MFMHFHNRMLRDKDGDSGGSGSGTGDDPDNKIGTTGDAKTFTQEQVNEIIADRLKRADDAVTKKLFDGLGVKDAAELKNRLGKAKEIEDAQKSDLDKAKADAEAEKQRADKFKGDLDAAQSELNRQRMRIEFGMQARRANVEFANAQAEEDAFALADLSGVEVDSAGKVKSMKDAFEKLQRDRPYLFGKEEAANPNTDARNGKSKTKPDSEAIRRRYGL